MPPPSIVIVACIAMTACSPARGASGTPAGAELPAPERVTRVGSFHMVWNTRPHYFVTDDAGVTTELLMSEEVARPLGGPLKLIGQRVRVSGDRVTDPQGAVRVLTIEPATGGR